LQQQQQQQLDRSEKLFVYILSWYKIAHKVLLEYCQFVIITGYDYCYTLPSSGCPHFEFHLPVFAVELRLQTKNTRASSHAGSTTPWDNGHERRLDPGTASSFAAVVVDSLTTNDGVMINLGKAQNISLYKVIHLM